MNIIFCFRRNIKIDYSPGGVSQNTVRIIQGLVNIPSFCAFFGSCGNDEEGCLVEAIVRETGVIVRYMVHIYPYICAIKLKKGVCVLKLMLTI